MEVTQDKIELIEYQKVNSKDNDCLQDCCLDLLEKYLEKNKLSSALKVTASGIKATSYVGVIKLKKTQIEILPKLIAPFKNDSVLDDKERENYRQIILNNLLFMLSYIKSLI